MPPQPAGAQATAHTHKQSTDQRGCQRVVCQIGPKGRKLLDDPVDRREANRGHSGADNEYFAQHFPADPVADHIDHSSADGGGYMQPMLQKQYKAQLSTLCHTGERVDMIKPKGQDGAA